MKPQQLFLLFLPGIIFFTIQTNAQCPSGSFTLQDSVCSGLPVNITNTTSGATQFEWDFCGGDFKFTPTVSNNPTSVPGPRSIDPVFDGTNWYAFTINKDSYSIGRFDFGNSLSNSPTYSDIGNPGNFMGGIVSNNLVLYQETGNWFGLASSFQFNYLIKYEFGPSLTNTTPIATTITYPFTYTGCQFQQLVNDQGNLFLFVGNALNPIITRYNFGNSISNAPSVDTIVVPGVTELNSIKIVKNCDQWIAFGVTISQSEVVRFNFNTDLSSSPVITNLGNIGALLLNPISLDLVFDAGSWYCLVQNFALGTTLYNIGSDLNTASGGIQGSISFNTNGNYINIVKEQSKHYCFVASVSNSNISIAEYSSPCDAVPAIFSGQNPGAVSFSTFGSHFISLKATDVAGNISYTSDSVFIKENPLINISSQNLCFGDTTQFFDSSLFSSGTINSRLWNFGFSSTSTLQDPTYSFPAPGSYSVTLSLTASNGCAATDSTEITIASNPTASFSFIQGCSMTDQPFSDQSTSGTGTISRWLWDFGNNDTSNVQNPIYAFPAGGVFSVTLTVTDDLGCYNSDSNSLTILHRPVAGFQAENTCINLPVQFTDSSTVIGTSISSYAWNFGDSIGNSSIPNPFYTYSNSVATYNVQLIVTAANGCTDTVERLIKINEIPSANFIIQPGPYCEGMAIQLYDSSFVSGDTLSNWFWDFGDGHVSSLSNPIHQYTSGGSYSISLIAYSPSSCPSPISQQAITILSSPNANFSSSTTCYGVNTQFTDMSTAPTGTMIISHSWDFGTGDSSSFQNPAYLFSTSGTQQVTLLVTTDVGCTDLTTLPVEVYQLPVASFTNSKSCANQAVNFINSSTTDSLSYLSSYSWNFGDFSSSSNTSNLPDPSHTYLTQSNYTVYLISTTNHGCVDTVSRTLTVYPTPSTNFTYSPTCYGDLVSFFNPGTSIDTAYIWNFGDGQINQLKEPAHYYAFPGSYSVTLTTYSAGGCTNSATRNVHVSPIPNANFISSPACIGTAYQFIDSSTIGTGSITEWHWTIDQQTSLDSVRTPSYLFTDSGSYSVTLKVISDIGCENQRTKTINVYGLPKPNFSFTPQFGNPPLDVQFTDLSSNGSTYSWNFGDGSSLSTTQNPTHIYSDTGLFVINQVVTSLYGCKDSTNKNIYAIKPILDIAIIGDSSYVQGDHFYIVARVANLGTRAINSFKIEAQLENGTIIQETSNTILPTGPAGIQTYPFNASFQIETGSTVRYYCIRVKEPNNSVDDKITNNEKCYNRTTQLVFVQPYPNPFTSKVNVKVVTPFEEHLSIKVADFTGKIIRDVYEGLAPKGLVQHVLDMSEFSDGTYFLQVNYLDEISAYPMIKTSAKK